jgi:uncharacterized repeat protein (TIGR01451 family)
MVTVVDTLPAGLTATAMSGAGWTCTVATRTCTRIDVLAVSANYPPIVVTVNVAANASGSMTNIATVSGGGDTIAANNTASDPTTVLPAGSPDLMLVKTHVGNFNMGQVGALYVLTVSNIGSGSTTGTVTVSDVLPASLTATAIGGTGWGCTLGSLTCARSDVLDVGSSYPPITLTVDVARDAPAAVTNIATVSGGGDSTPANNTSADIVVMAQIVIQEVPTMNEWCVALLAIILGFWGSVASGYVKRRR